jgi:hypothetical protein
MQQAQEQSLLLQDKDPAVRQIGWDGIKEFMEKYKAERDRTSVADLLQRPLRREFIKPLQAAQYADRLKTKILVELILPKPGISLFVLAVVVEVAGRPAA